MPGRIFEVQANQEVQVIFELMDDAGNLVSGQAANVGKRLRDQDSATADSTETVTVAEQGTSGFYEARFTPTKSSPFGHTYYLRLTAPTPATDGGIISFGFRSFPTLMVSEIVGAFFTSLANVKEYASITGAAQDGLITNLIARVTRVMQDRLERKIFQTTYTEVKDGMGRPGISIFERPIASVTSLHESQDQVWDATTLIAASDYILDPVKGLIWLKGDVFLPGFQNVRVVYIGGYASVPAALEHVAIRTVARELRTRTSLEILSMSLKDGSVVRKIAAGFTRDDLEDMAPWIRRRAA